MTANHELDLTRYEGATPGDWIDVDLRTATGENRREEISICFGEYVDGELVGGTIARIRNEISGRPLAADDEANARLIADAPLLLAEVVRLRADVAELVKSGNRMLRALDKEAAATMSVETARDNYSNSRPDEEQCIAAILDASSAQADFMAALAKHGGAS